WPVQTKGGLMDYAASKAALNSYTRSIAAEAAQHGMKAVMIDPGWVQTRMGGDNAALTPDETVAGMINVIENLTPEQNGAFLTHDGTPQLW
ncbi:MAG: SDR family NAD(P)-dependent oxidoreductase, partial [Chloroflexota bacterium]